jgi:hypothetical protein
MTWKTHLALASIFAGIAGWFGYRGAAVSPAPVEDSEPAELRHSVTATSRESMRERLLEIRHSKNGFGKREKAEAWAMIRGFTLDEVKAELAKLAENLDSPASVDEAEILIFRWAQMDPEAAAEASLKPPYDTGVWFERDALTAWMANDPEVALKWACASGDRGTKTMACGMAAKRLARIDPVAAMSKAASLDPLVLKNVMITLGGDMAGTPEDRDKFLKITGSQISTDEWSEALKRLTDTWTKCDPEGAFAGVAQLAIPKEEKDEAKDNVLAIWARNDQGAVLDWMRSQDAGSVKPARLLYTYQTWANREPEKASAWAAQCGDPAFAASMVHSRALDMLTHPWPSESKSISETTALRSDFQTWQKLQPDAAAEWLQRMPSDLKGKLTATDDAGR